MSSVLILLPITWFLLFNHQRAWGSPWRPRRFGSDPETRRARLQRWMALSLTCLTIAAVWLVVLTIDRRLVVHAQAEEQRDSAPAAPADDGQARAQEAIVGSMSGHQMHNATAHLRLTPKWAERPGDRERAATIVNALRAALERYRDYHAAERNGYEIFHPEIPQSIYHFTNYWEGFAETFRFTPDQATSLLYRKTVGAYELVGAMYTAPANASEFDLDARVPLSVARWHAHINICLPPRGEA